MKIIWKIAIPQGIVVILLGVVAYLTIEADFQEMSSHYVEDRVSSIYTTFDRSIEAAGISALQQASIFANKPEVVAAFEIAHQGNINDAHSPASQSARVMLRQTLAPELAYYSMQNGKKVKLHFHLPNGRSLARLWRSKQTKRNGAWVDISDDISSFRKTVLDVNRSGSPVRGIELGRGGFVVRGLVPVKGKEGKILGSAEVLVPFAPVLASVQQNGVQPFLFMNRDKLKVTTSLRDEKKYPHVGKEYVLVSAPKSFTGDTKDFPTILSSGKDGLSVKITGNTAYAAAPVADYKGKQIGVLVTAIDLTALNGLVNKADTSLLGVLAFILLLPLLVVFFIVRRFIVSPAQRMIETMRDENNFSQQIHINQQDEIGELVTWFNSLRSRITGMLDEMQDYVNVLNTVPDPVFAINDQREIILVNKAGADFVGLSEEECKGKKCNTLFTNDMCETEHCPMRMNKQTGMLAVANVTPLCDCYGKEYFVQPMTDALRDAKGNTSAYVQVVRGVTELVEKEQEVQSQLDSINEVNVQVHEAAGELAASAGSLEEEVLSVSDAVEIQRHRIAETATAMEQMSSTVLEVARSAALASECTVNTSEKAQQGAGIVSKAQSSIKSVSENAEAMRTAMDSLGAQADSIGAVLGVISDIADQTNLLALNAAIEAARAGEAGRGFAVVADEVRKLAEKTMQATQEVATAIKSIQDRAKESIITTDSTHALVAEASDYARNSAKALEEIVALADDSAGQVQSIATAAEEQSASSEQIRNAVDEVNALIEDISGRMSGSAKSVTSLAKLAGQMDELATQH